MLNRKTYISCAISLCLLTATCLVNAETLTVTAAEYGDKWSFTVDKGELECPLGRAVIMHTSKGTYSINGKAMTKYREKYPTWREISKLYPGLNDPNAKMPPPGDLIERGLKLCR